VTPDGAHVYLANECDNTVSAIDTASNIVTATVSVGMGPVGVSVTPDGRQVYVANSGDATVSVIAAASNTVTATVPVGRAPAAFGQFIRSASTVPFASFIAHVEIERSHRITRHAGDSFEVEGRAVLGELSNGIAPNAEEVTLRLGSFSLTIPAGSFVATRDNEGEDEDRDGRVKRDEGDSDARNDVVTTYHFKGVIAGVSLDATIEQGPQHAFRFGVNGRHANLRLVHNPVTVSLAIGDDEGNVLTRTDIHR
jgi:YVTN family beta-propeller protein